MKKPKIKKSKNLPDGVKKNFKLAQVNTGINSRFTSKHYKNIFLVKKKLFLYFFKTLNLINPEYKYEKYKNIEFLKRINSYKGVRHKLGLPVRGQCTKTNAKTEKNKRSKEHFFIPKKLRKKKELKKNDKNKKL